MLFRCRPELLAIALSVVACDRLGDLQLELPRPNQPEEPEPDPVDIKTDKNPAKDQPVPGNKKGGIVDLGTAVYPDGTKPAGAVAFNFNVPPTHRLAYRVSDDEQKAVMTFFNNFAKSVQFKRMGPKAFQWIPPPGCPGDMSCVYKKLVQRTHDDIMVIAQRFKKRADDFKLNSLQVAEIALSYVQNIPYQVPEEPFGILPPPLVIARQKGDCDSKSLLLYMILNQLGIETVILSSQAHHHSLTGIALPTPGTSFRWKDRKYAFAETTAKGAPIGYMPKDLVTPNDWVVELAP
jgi:hypothetical protein